jgi:hypothetical protein
MDFLTTYCSAGVGNLIYNFLTVEDEQRLDSTCKTVREFHRKDLYPVTHSYVYVDGVFDLMENPHNEKARCSYMRKIAGFIQEIASDLNDGCMRLPGLTRLTQVREIHFAIPIMINTWTSSIHRCTYAAWESIENILRQKNEMEDHPLRSVHVVPGNIYLVKEDIDGNILTTRCIEDHSETTHLEYYRWFGDNFPGIYIPTSLCINMYMPSLWIWPNDSNEYGTELKYWSWDGSKDSVGMLMLELIKSAAMN